MVESLHILKDRPWRVLEFYSGIGGMRYSLMKAGVNAEVVEAFDINDVANDVYELNFGHRPFQGNIQNLTAADLSRYGADAWLLSPPCQPYTRQGLQKQSGDSRAFSFLNILELMPHMSELPRMLFVENVVGFEISDTHTKMIEILARSNYETQEFILSPLQFGVPYSRPRYFCLGRRKPLSFQYQLFNKRLLFSPGPLLGDEYFTAIQDCSGSEEGSDELLKSCEPIEKFLESKDSIGHQGRESRTPVSSVDPTCSPDSSDSGESASDSSSIEQYLVPTSLIKKLGSAMDIVYPDSKRCCCFTKSYYRYVKGTGSLLATSQRKIRGKTSLEDQRLRYFTPREVANLHSFPADFQFPEHVTLRQRYALLGNSLSVVVVAALLQYLFKQPS